jgi:GT2 family glycosyltransferase
VVTLSAIVPATNNPPTLARCTAAIQGAEEPPEQLVVVRDADAPGPAAARNHGARRATSDVLVFIDADVAIHPDALARIRRAFDEDERLAALFGSYDDRPSDQGVVSVFRNLLHHHVHQSAPGPASTFWSGIGAIRRETFERAGGFDQIRFAAPSVEDIELGMRLSRAGARIVLDPAVQGTHLKRWTLRQMLGTDLVRRGVPWVELLLESRSPSSALNLGWRHRLSTVAVLATVAALATRRLHVAAAGVGALVALNRSFYALLVRRRGAPEAAAGVLLHSLHHLTAAVSVPIGVVRHARRRIAR